MKPGPGYEEVETLHQGFDELDRFPGGAPTPSTTTARSESCPTSSSPETHENKFASNVQTQ